MCVNVYISWLIKKGSAHDLISVRSATFGSWFNVSSTFPQHFKDVICPLGRQINMTRHANTASWFNYFNYMTLSHLMGTAQPPWEPPHSCRKHGKSKKPKQPGSLHTAVENIENLRTYAIYSIRRGNKHGRPPSVTKCFPEKPKQPGNRSIKNSHRTWTSDAGPNTKTFPAIRGWHS